MSEAWMQIAERELGVKEKSGKAHNKRIVEYFAVSGHREIKDDETAWCAAFVNFCLEKANLKGTLSLAARSFLRYGKHCEPKPGCIMVFKRGKESWQGHVTFLKRILPDGRFLCLGGNQGNQVKETVYSKAALLDSRWPSTMGTSRTVKASAVGGVSTIGGFVTEQAQEIKYFSQEAQEYWSMAGYVALTCSALCIGLVIYYKYLDIKEKG